MWRVWSQIYPVNVAKLLNLCKIHNLPQSATICSRYSWSEQVSRAGWFRISRKSTVCFSRSCSLRPAKHQ
jgi:hypothetical protein